jgi:hypothetical protein
MTKTLLLLFAVGCAADPATTSPDPVATFPTRTGTTIELYGEGSGGFSMMEAGNLAHEQPAVDQQLAKTLSPTQIYLAAANDANVPDAIAELTASLVASGREFTSTVPTETVASGPSDIYDGCNAQEYEVHECDTDAGDVTWCMLDHRNGAFEHIGSANVTGSSLCMKIGTSSWHITNGAGGDHQWTMFQGDYRWYVFNSGIWSNDWVHYDVNNAQGSTFQFSGDSFN